ncbi:MAG: tetratricopeptide repeat protein [Thermostichus sp. HHBFW_bins_43]
MLKLEDIEAIKERAKEALRNADFATALHLLEPLENEQDSEVLSLLSMLHETNVAGAEDPEKAFQLLVRASDLGDGNASYALAIKYLPTLPPDKSRIVPGDRQKAEQLYLKAKSQGAIIPYLGQFDYLDPSLPFSARQADHLHEGVQAYFEGSFERAAAFFLPLAVEEADPVAQLVVARLYRYGLGLPKDETESVRWYERAAEAGNGEACYHLAQIYFRGECGVTMDGDEYAKWIGKAKEQGFLTEQGLVRSQVVMDSASAEAKILRAFSVIPNNQR